MTKSTLITKKKKLTKSTLRSFYQFPHVELEEFSSKYIYK